MRVVARGWVLLQSWWLLQLNPSRAPTTCSWCRSTRKPEPAHLMCTGAAFRISSSWGPSWPDVPCACALRDHTTTYRGDV